MIFQVFDFRNSIYVGIILIEIIVAVGLLYLIYLILARKLYEREMTEPKILSIFITLLTILILATLYYALQNNSGMATATATMVLVIITAFYAWNTHLQVEAMQNQVSTMEGQVRVMQDQLFFERTFGPRLDAYKKLMDVMSFNPKDTQYIKGTIFPILDYVQPFASEGVKEAAKRIYESAKTEKGIQIPTGFVDRINDEIIPIIKNEIENITDMSI